MSKLIMTQVRGALTGTHPMGEDLIQAILDFKYGRAGKERVKDLFQKELNDLLQLQESVSFPILSNGSFGIEDLIRPFTRSLKSLKSYEVLGDLPINRWHFTNTFYRQPTLVSTFPETASVLLNDTHSLTDENVYSHSYLEGKKAKIILPGPISLAYLIDSNQQSVYKTKEELIRSTGNYLAAEIASLPAQYVEIQFDEPNLVWDRVPRTLRSAIQDSYSRISEVRGNRNLLVHTYFESAENVISFLLDLPVQGIGIDFTETNLLKLSEYDLSGTTIQAGVIDPQNFVPNSKGGLDKSNTKFLVSVSRAIRDLNPKELIIGSTTGFEYLPREIADARVRQIGDIVSTLREETQ